MQTTEIKGAASHAPKTNDNTREVYSESRDFRKKNQYDLEQECVAFMAAHSFPIEQLIVDSSWQRLSTDGGDDQDEWYTAAAGVSSKGNSWLMCSFGTWAGGKKVFGTYRSWHQEPSIPLEERRSLDREYVRWETEQKKKTIQVNQGRVKKAQDVWANASDNPQDTAYLERKRVGCHGIKFGSRVFNDGTKEAPIFKTYSTTIIPLHNAEGVLQGVQHIRPDGKKRFDGIVSGNFHIIGEIQQGRPILLSEGYATASSLFEAVNLPVVVAFNCSNLDPVAAVLRKQHAKNRIIIAGDDDIGTPGNPGRSAAEKVSLQYKCQMAFPMFSEDGSQMFSDWNDLHVFFGIEEVRRQLEPVIRPKARLVTMSHKAFLAKQIPPRKFVLKPWLPEGAIAMIFAPTGVGKSYLCLSATGIIAGGGSLFQSSPWTVEKPQRTLFIDGEMHEADLQTRVKKLLHNIEDKILDGYLEYLNGSWQTGTVPDLCSEEGQAMIEELIARQGTEVLFLDNLSTLCRSGRENEVDSWRAMQSWLLQLRWRGISIVLVHHASKTKDENGLPRQRGTSLREITLESSIVLDRPKDYDDEMGCVFELHYNKARGFYGADAASMEVQLKERDGLFFWEDKKLSVKTYNRVVDLYLDGVTNVGELAQEIGISPQMVRRHIKKGKMAKDIV